jgi:hypothetical protein
MSASEGKADMMKSITLNHAVCALDHCVGDFETDGFRSAQVEHQFLAAQLTGAGLPGASHGEAACRSCWLV